MVYMVHRYHGALPGLRAKLYSEICQVPAISIERLAPEATTPTLLAALQAMLAVSRGQNAKSSKKNTELRFAYWMENCVTTTTPYRSCIGSCMCGTR